MSENNQQVIPEYSKEGAEREANARAESDIVTSSVAGVPAFQLISNRQYVTIKNWAMNRYDLEEGDFIVNMYGLPFMPLPHPRKVNNATETRTIPKHLLESTIITHPIFWVDPIVLGDIPTDPVSQYAQEWSIRMYAFLFLCGCYTEHFEAVDFLSTKNIQVVSDTGQLTSKAMSGIRDHYEGFGVVSQFDNVKYMTYEDIVVDPSRYGKRTKKECYEHVADKLVAKCQKILSDEQKALYEDLERTLELSRRYLFANDGEGEPLFAYEDRGSRWSIHFEARFAQLFDEYRRAVDGEGYSQLVLENIKKFTSELEKDVENMDNISAIIIGPTLYERGSLTPEDISVQQSYYLLSRDTVNSKNRYKYTLRDIVISPGVTVSEVDTKHDGEEESEDSWKVKTNKRFNDFMNERQEVYRSTWERLFLCFANYLQAYDGNNHHLYSSFNEAVWDIKTNRVKKG